MPEKRQAANESRVGLTDLLAAFESLRVQIDSLEKMVREMACVPPKGPVLSVDQWLRLHEFPISHRNKLKKLVELIDAGMSKEEIFRVYPRFQHRGWNKALLPQIDRLIELRRRDVRSS